MTGARFQRFTKRPSGAMFVMCIQSCRSRTSGAGGVPLAWIRSVGSVALSIGVAGIRRSTATFERVLYEPVGSNFMSAAAAVGVDPGFDSVECRYGSVHG